MPITDELFIDTKAVLVKERQVALALMHEEPWAVDKVSIDNDGEVLVKFHQGPSINVGRLKSKYASFYRRNLHVQRWKVTGGEPIPGYISEHGVRLRTYGLNLRLLIVTDEAKTLSHVGGVLEQA